MSHARKSDVQKVALVTGATAGIGRATALTLARDGIAVIATGRKRDAGAETVKLIEDAGGRAAFIAHDANIEDEWIAAISGTIAAFGTPPESTEETMVSLPKRKLSRLFLAERAVKKEFFGSRNRPGISTVMVDAFNIMQDRITRARLAGDPPDVLISPRLGRIGWFDFHHAAEIAAAGARAAERQIESIHEAVALIAPTSNAPLGTSEQESA